MDAAGYNLAGQIVSSYLHAKLSSNGHDLILLAQCIGAVRNVVVVPFKLENLNVPGFGQRRRLEGLQDPDSNIQLV